MTPVAVLFARTDSVYKTHNAAGKAPAAPADGRP